MGIRAMRQRMRFGKSRGVPIEASARAESVTPYDTGRDRDDNVVSLTDFHIAE
jgi:hypothetical protein